MPHDQNNAELNVGDIVTITCRVTNVSAQEEYCNVTMETLLPMPPYTTPNSITLNTKQVVLLTKGSVT